jgi:hypothetical protein
MTSDEDLNNQPFPEANEVSRRKSSWASVSATRTAASPTQMEAAFASDARYLPLGEVTAAPALLSAAVPEVTKRKRAAF